MIDIVIKDVPNEQSLWFHFDTYNEAVDVIISALVTGYTVYINKAEKE